MSFCRTAIAAVAVAACSLMAGCAQDTPRSVFQNSDEYANRVFVPSMVSTSVREAATDNKPLPFNKIMFSRTSKISYQGTLIDVSADVVYENAGQGLVRQIEVGYRNGVVDGQQFSLSYRGLLSLHSQEIRPTYSRMPYSMDISSVSHFDTSFDQPTLSYIYQLSSDNPRFKTAARRGACTLTSTYAGSKLAAGITGDAREFDCKFYNDNGVMDADSIYVYLNNYGVAILKHIAKTNMTVNWTISNFKAT